MLIRLVKLHTRQTAGTVKFYDTKPLLSLQDGDESYRSYNDVIVTSCTGLNQVEVTSFCL